MQAHHLAAELLQSVMQDAADAVALMLDYVASQLESRQNFDQAQGVLALVLNVHGAAITAVPRLSALVDRIHHQLASGWAQLDDDINAVQCMISLFSEVQL
jgi:Utp21 specific WD40 associated putative domain